MYGKHNNKPNKKAKDRKTYFTAFILYCYNLHSPSPSTQATPFVGSLVWGWGSIFGENIQAPTMRGKGWDTPVLIPGVWCFSGKRSILCPSQLERQVIFWWGLLSLNWALELGSKASHKTSKVSITIASNEPKCK